MYKTFKNLPENPKNPMKQVISGAITNRKGTMKMGVKNDAKNDAKNPPKMKSKNHPKTSPNSPSE
jgi:hypothetical protein